MGSGVTDDGGADLADIIAAFEACDIDGDNRISASELHAVLVALGATVSLADVREQIKLVKGATDVTEPSPFVLDRSVANPGGGSEYGIDAYVGIVVRKKKLLRPRRRKKVRPVVRTRYAERDYRTLALGAHTNLGWYKRHHEEVHNQLQLETGLHEETDQDYIDTETKQYELNDEDFVRFIKGPYLHRYFRDEHWRSRVREICKLRRAYDVADIDGDNEMQRDELRLVLTALRPHDPPDPAEIDRIWRALVPADKANLISESLSWEDFLRRLPAARADPEVGHILNDLSRPNEWEMVSLLIDIKTSEETIKNLERGLSFFEWIANKTLQWMDRKKKMDKGALHVNLRKACAGELHMLDDKTRHNIRRHKRNMALTACFIGFVCNTCVGMIENYAMWTTGNSGIWENYYMCNNISAGDGIIGKWPPSVPGCDTCGWPEISLDCNNCKNCEVAQVDSVLTFVAIDGASVVFWMGTELLLLAAFAVKFACRIAAEYKYRLYPLNAERAFVAHALIRQCLEMGNPKSPVGP